MSKKSRAPTHADFVNQIARDGTWFPPEVSPSTHGSDLPRSMNGQPLGVAELALSLPVPPSINHQYATVRGRRVLSSTGRRYKNQIRQEVLCRLADHPDRTILFQTLQSSYLALTIHFFFKSPLRRDVDGGLKIAQDALCEALDVNDSRIVEIHLFKSVQASQPRIDVSIRPSAVGTPD